LLIAWTPAISPEVNSALRSMGEKAVFTAAERRRVTAIDRREVDIRKEGRRGRKIFRHPPPFGLVKDLGRGLGVRDRTLGNMAPGSTDTGLTPLRVTLHSRLSHRGRREKRVGAALTCDHRERRKGSTEPSTVRLGFDPRTPLGFSVSSGSSSGGGAPCRVRGATPTSLGFDPRTPLGFSVSSSSARWGIHIVGRRSIPRHGTPSICPARSPGACLP
jgi:hypothetical protein